MRDVSEAGRAEPFERAADRGCAALELARAARQQVRVFGQDRIVALGHELVKQRRLAVKRGGSAPQGSRVNAHVTCWPTGSTLAEIYGKVLTGVTPTSSRAFCEIALSRDLPDRVKDKATLERHVGARQRRRDTATTRAEWRFTTVDAHIKLRKLYPTMDA